jgi:hypothetical protein
MRAAWPALAAASAAFAQCPLCRNAVAAQGPQAAATIDQGILILLVPAIVMFSGVLMLSFRYRDSSGGDETE